MNLIDKLIKTDLHNTSLSQVCCAQGFSVANIYDKFIVSELEDYMRKGDVFSLSLFVSNQEIRKIIMQAGEQNRIGKGENFLLSFEGSVTSTLGDVNMTNIGNVEVKFGKAQLKNYKEKNNSSIKLQLKNFSYKELTSLITRTDMDSDEIGTRIATCINWMFPQSDKAADLCLTKGFIKRIQTSDNIKDAINNEILYPLYDYGFDYLKAVGQYDGVFLMNYDNAVYIRSGSACVAHIKNKVVSMSPSDIKFTGERTGGLSLTLKV